MRFSLITFAVILVLSCNPREPEFNPVGTWQNTTHWDGNVITLTVRPDSIMLFKTERSTNGSTQFLVATGMWHVEADSFLVMEPATSDQPSLDLQAAFPELVQQANDFQNVTVLEVSARLIMRDSLIYDLKPDGTAEPLHTYKKIAR